MKIYTGRIPDEKNGWNLCWKFLDNDGLEWGFYIKPQKHTDEWFTCKLVAHGKALAKANYWFVLNVNEMRIGFSRDIMVLNKNKPELSEKLFDEMVKFRENT